MFIEPSNVAICFQGRSTSFFEKWLETVSASCADALMRRLVILFFLFAIYCGKEPSGPRVPLVLIHGIKGAALKDSNGQRVWLTRRQALGWQTPTLALPTQWKAEEQLTDGTVQDGILPGMTIIPFFASEKIYDPIISAAQSMERPFYTFSYDWRRDNIENLANFIKFLKEIKQKHNLRVQVVAHSMGGLITRAALAEEPDLFDSVVFAGVPFGGGIGFLPDVHAGVPVGLNKKILSPEVMFTFPSVYTLFQESGSRIFASDADGEKEIPMDFYDFDDWSKNRLGLFAIELVSPAQASHLRMCLKRAKDFRKRVREPVKTSIPIYVVLSKSTPTLAGAIKDGPKAIRGYDFETRPKEGGDGRILEKDALPTGFKFETIYSTQPHSDLLNDSAVIDVVRKLGEH